MSKNYRFARLLLFHQSCIGGGARTNRMERALILSLSLSLSLSATWIQPCAHTLTLTFGHERALMYSEAQSCLYPTHPDTPTPRLTHHLICVQHVPSLSLFSSSLPSHFDVIQARRNSLRTMTTKEPLEAILHIISMMELGLIKKMLELLRQV